MPSERTWAVLRRIERVALWIALPSLIAMLVAVYAKASNGVVVWLVSIAILSSSVWMGIHLGLGPLLTGKARLSMIVYSVPVPDAMARLVGALYLLMAVIGFFVSILVMAFAT